MNMEEEEDHTLDPEESDEVIIDEDDLDESGDKVRRG